MSTIEGYLSIKKFSVVGGGWVGDLQVNIVSVHVLYVG